jgi:hypothetical protein
MGARRVASMMSSLSMPRTPNPSKRAVHARHIPEGRSNTNPSWNGNIDSPRKDIDKGHMMFSVLRRMYILGPANRGWAFLQACL